MFCSERFHGVVVLFVLVVNVSEWVCGPSSGRTPGSGLRFSRRLSMNRLGAMTRTDGYVTHRFSPRGARRDRDDTPARLAFVTPDARSVVGPAVGHCSGPHRRRVYAPEGRLGL